MPPPISDDEEASDGASTPTPIASTKSKSPKQTSAKPEGVEDEAPEELEVEQEAGSGEEDEELGEDESVATGELRFKVKWLGFEKKSDQTWEPEQNLADTDILKDYYESVGGRDLVLAAGKPKSKKRGRSSTSSAAPETGASGKRRRGERHPKSASPPLSVKKEEFKAPSGSWEEMVQSIDACEGTHGNIQVYLHWVTGEKTKHALEMVYKRCPQKVCISISS
ncbi:MAG: hypothetical protein M1818_006050 [Claussenomyces sp. TS43310]|nr:MAG: hypothetical protein M1818_006050 [Claussenomyces sp. TS43310]